MGPGDFRPLSFRLSPEDLNFKRVFREPLSCVPTSEEEILEEIGASLNDLIGLGLIDIGDLYTNEPYGIPLNEYGIVLSKKGFEALNARGPSE